MTNLLNIDFAIAKWSRGKRGVMGIRRLDDGNLVCQGLGCNGKVLALWIEINGKFYDAKTLDHMLIIRKSIDKKPGWAVFFSSDEKHCTTSEDSFFDLRCIVAVEPTQQQRDMATSGNEKVPIFIKIKYKYKFGAVVVTQDIEHCKLFNAEGEEMAQKMRLSSTAMPEIGSEQHAQSTY